MADFGPEDFRAATGVSRETLARLQKHGALLSRWQRTINLVARDSLADMWRRHFLDSAQLRRFIDSGTGILLDAGSGAGFPGMVLAIMGAAREVHLVESDRRKAAFLREVSRETSAPVTVHAERIERMTAPVADVLTARALAPLDRLLALTAALRDEDTICLFPKGADAASELTEAREHWMMRAECFPSITAPEASILKLTGIRRVD